MALTSVRAVTDYFSYLASFAVCWVMNLWKTAVPVVFPVLPPLHKLFLWACDCRFVSEINPKLLANVWHHNWCASYFSLCKPAKIRLVNVSLNLQVSKKCNSVRPEEQLNLTSLKTRGEIFLSSLFKQNDHSLEVETETFGKTHKSAFNTVK